MQLVRLRLVMAARLVRGRLQAHRQHTQPATGYMRSHTGGACLRLLVVSAADCSAYPAAQRVLVKSIGMRCRGNECVQALISCLMEVLAQRGALIWLADIHYKQSTRRANLDRPWPDYATQRAQDQGVSHYLQVSMSSVALMMPSCKPLMASCGSQYIHHMVILSCQPEAALAAVGGGVSQYLTTRAASRFSSSTARTSEALVAMEMT